MEKAARSYAEEQLQQCQMELQVRVSVSVCGGGQR